MVVTPAQSCDFQVYLELRLLVSEGQMLFHTSGLLPAWLHFLACKKH